MNLSTHNVSEDTGAAISRLQRIFFAHNDFQQRVAELKSIHSGPHRLRDEKYLAETFQTFKLGRQASYFTEEEYIFYARFYVENIHQHRLLSDVYMAELTPIENQIRRIEKEHGLADDEYWPTGEGPEEYQQLNQEYEKILDSQILSIYREMGEDDIAELFENNLAKFDALHEIGRKALFESLSETERLRTLLDRYKREAYLSFEIGAHYGACALLGACLETMLLLLCYYYPKEAEEARSAIPSSHRPRTSNPNKWSLSHLIHIAAASGWLPILKTGDVELDISGWVNLIRSFRNLLHPGNHLATKERGHIGSQEFEDANAVFIIVEEQFVLLESQVG